MRDILTEIWSTARRNKLRTALTGFAVAWGIFMLIFLLGCGNGLINAQKENMNRFLDNSMMVGGGRTSKAYDGLSEGRRITLNDRDIKTTETGFTEHIDGIGAQVERDGVNISLDDNYFSGSLLGVYPNEQQISKVEILHGRFINQTDLDMQRKVLVLDDEQAKELLPRNYKTLVGKYVKVGNLAFKVVGISKSDKSRFNSSVHVPFTTLRTMYNLGDMAETIVFTFHGLETESANEDFEKSYQKPLNSNHRAAPDDESAIWIWNRFTQNMQMNKGVSIIRTALWVIGIFTLLSGVVGVSNIMLITVKERTKEFGIRKAIGATPGSLLRLIIIESVLITTFFGYIGMVIGMGANLYMDATVGHTKVDSGVFEATMFVNPTVGFDVCVEATLVMILAGTIAGMIPARKAARTRPIEALRAE
ncbi:MAG: ABC transporter permease [Prevotella sp.]|nr:ABC transporter permease [Prevotella sp.]